MNVRICPKCNSPNVILNRAIWWGDRRYECKRCGLVSTLFPEITIKKPEELKKLRLKKVMK